MRVLTKTFCMLLLILICGLYLSCTIWNTTQWKDLQNRDFYLTRFVVYNKGSNSTNAFRLMQSFQLKKTMEIISRKYNININISNFNEYIKNGKASDLEVFGVLTNDRFTWENTDRKLNVIEIEYNLQGKETFDGMIPKYIINIKTDGKLRAIHSDAVENVNQVPASLIEILFSSSDKYAAIPGNEAAIVDDSPARPSARINKNQMGIFFDSPKDLEKARQLLEKEFMIKIEE